MSEPSIPPPLEQFGARPFSFYPPILNVEHNEWAYEQATWAEIKVRNTKSGLELWVPRRYLGEISQVDEPVMIVGLGRQLEYKSGLLIQHERRVLSMPRGPSRAAGSEDLPPPPRGGAGRGMESPAERRIGKLILGALVVGILGCVLIVSIFRGRAGDRVEYHGIIQASLGLTAGDDTFAVVRRLGQPAGEAWYSEVGALQYRAMRYPDYTIILMGTERDKVRYIGAMNKEWKPIDAVQLPDGRSTASMLRALRRF
ncbi:MAG: hypothetical protein HY822_00075 [Acidobacteria bacterium]|nr:hypothetical protein [Acidobacteriota bacterium]